MFLSKEAIFKQLFYEFLQHDNLALSPGRPVELLPGTLLGSSSKEDLSLGLEWAERQLQHLCTIGTPAENLRFKDLLSKLIRYKKGEAETGNPFNSYAAINDIPPFHPSVWLLFAPKLIQGRGNELSYDTKEAFLNILNTPEVALKFKATGYPLQKSGLYIAVKTKNYEMVKAFLCPEFFQYELTKNDLNILLSLTSDPKTRLVLLHHSPRLLDWLRDDSALKKNIILSTSELMSLWANWSKKERASFIQNTSSTLWLNLLTNQLSKKEIETVLGNHFPALKQKLINDQTIKDHESLTRVIHYLDHDGQFNYLLKIKNLDQVYPLPHDKHFLNLLTSLGYKTHPNGSVTTTRYLLPEKYARIHDRLIQALIMLPIKTSVILDALKKIEAFVYNNPPHNNYVTALEATDQSAEKIVDEGRYFIQRWFYKLLRRLKLIKKSPLHAYIHELKQAVDAALPNILTGELVETILPELKDSQEYKDALIYFTNHRIKDFWTAIPEEARKLILQEPIRFEGLLHILTHPTEGRLELFQSLDKRSLIYLNTLQGIRQLLFETPSFNSEQHLPILVQTMLNNHLVFLDDIQLNVELLSESNERLFNQIEAFLPYKQDTPLQAKIIDALPKPLNANQFTKFMKGSQMNAQKFSALLKEINKTNPLLVTQCWQAVSDTQWREWYGSLEHATEWSLSLSQLDIDERIEFFDKLTSDGVLTAEEFCDLLLDKGSKISFLWEKIPDAQWATWINGNHLPPSTKTLLNCTALPLRLNLFKAMLTMTPLERMDFCMGPNNSTLDTFYPKETAKIIESAPTINAARIQLAKLKINKKEEFQTALNALVEAIKALDVDLTTVFNFDLKSKTTWSVWASSFIYTDPYQQQLSSMKKNTGKIQELQKIMLSYPLLADAKTNTETSEIMTALNEQLLTINNRLHEFNTIEAANMPQSLETQLTTIADILNRMEGNDSLTMPIENTGSAPLTAAIAIEPVVIEEPMVSVLKQAKKIMQDATIQLDAFYSGHSARFFKKISMGPKAKQLITQKLNELREVVQDLNKVHDEHPIHREMAPLINECLSSLNWLKEKYTACRALPGMQVVLQDECSNFEEQEEVLRGLLHEVILSLALPRTNSEPR